LNYRWRKVEQFNYRWRKVEQFNYRWRKVGEPQLQVEKSWRTSSTGGEKLRKVELQVEKYYNSLILTRWHYFSSHYECKK